jgi:DNA-binding CsgD family transcriptional regulator
MELPLGAQLDRSGRQKKRLSKVFLTKGEIEVLKLLLQGHAHKEIANSLNMTLRTVKETARNLNEKYGVWQGQLLSKFGHFEVKLVWVPTEEYESLFGHNNAASLIPIRASGARSAQR